MRIRPATLAAAALALLAGCGNENKCASESPQVSALPASGCTVKVGEPVAYPIRLCPTCNQSLTGCEVDTSSATAAGGTIFLNPLVEACESSSSCPAACNVSPAACTFTPPTSSTGVTYTVQVYDPGTGAVKASQLTTGSSTSCPFG